MRNQRLSELLQTDRLPTPPAIALEVISATGRPDCDPREVVVLLGLDGVLCANLLRAANSCLYATKQPVTSIGRAVERLGLKAVRALVLGLSLPALMGRGRSDPWLNDLWVSSVSGAVFARELAVRERRPPDDDFVAALLRDLGAVALRNHFRSDWDAHLSRNAGRLLTDPCGACRESFGVDHAEVSAALLRKWNLPVEVVEPIRYHHHPRRLSDADKRLARRAELLWFTDHLARLDVVADHSELLHPVLATAQNRFGMGLIDLIAFAEHCAPSVQAFAELLHLDLGSRSVSEVVATGVSALVDLRSGGSPSPAIPR